MSSPCPDVPFDGFAHLGDRTSAYLDGQLDPVEHAAVVAHLDACDHCRAVTASEAEVRTWLRALPSMDAPEAFMERLLAVGPRDVRGARRRSRFAAANLVAAAAAWILVIGVGHLTSPSSVSPQVSSFVTNHEASVAGALALTGATGSTSGTTAEPGPRDSVAPLSAGARGGMPSAASRYRLVAFDHDGVVSRATYTDGIDAVSVFRERGSLNWGAIDGGTEVRVGTGRGMVLERDQLEVLVFERSGYVYAVVAPVSSNVIDELAMALPSAPKPSLWDRIRGAGNSLLDCFGLRG